MRRFMGLCRSFFRAHSRVRVRHYRAGIFVFVFNVFVVGTGQSAVLWLSRSFAVLNQVHELQVMSQDSVGYILHAPTYWVSQSTAPRVRVGTFQRIWDLETPASFTGGVDGGSTRR